MSVPGLLMVAAAVESLHVLASSIASHWTDSALGAVTVGLVTTAMAAYGLHETRRLNADNWRMPMSGSGSLGAERPAALTTGLAVLRADTSWTQLARAFPDQLPDFERFVRLFREFSGLVDEQLGHPSAFELKVRIDAGGPPDLLAVEAICRGVARDLRRVPGLETFSDHDLALLEIVPGSWIIRVAVPLAALALSTISTSVTVDTWLRQPTSLKDTLEASCRTILGTAKGKIEITADTGFHLRMDCNEARVRAMQTTAPEPTQAPVTLPATRNLMLPSQQSDLDSREFQGNFVAGEFPMIDAPILAPYPLVMIDVTRPPHTLTDGVGYIFEGVLRRDASGALIGVFIRSARIIEESRWHR